MAVNMDDGVFASGINCDYIHELLGSRYDTKLNSLSLSIMEEVERAVRDTLERVFPGSDIDLSRMLAGSDLAWQTEHGVVVGACCIWQHDDFVEFAARTISDREPAAWRRLSLTQRLDTTTRLGSHLEELAADAMRDNATMDGWETMREIADESLSREDVRSFISTARAVDESVVPGSQVTSGPTVSAAASAPFAFRLIREGGDCIDLPSLDALMGACSWLGWEDGPDGVTSIYGYLSATDACEDMNVELSHGPSDPGRYDEAVYCAHAMSYDTLVGVCGRTHEEAVEFMGIAPDQIELVNDSIRTHNVSRETPIPLASVGTDHVVPRHR